MDDQSKQELKTTDKGNLPTGRVGNPRLILVRILSDLESSTSKRH